MPNINQFNTMMFNAGGNILTLDLSDSVTQSDSRAVTIEKLLAEILTPGDVAALTLNKVLFDTFFFSDGLALLVYSHKVLPEVITMTAWLTVEKDRRNSDPSRWTGV